MSLAPFKPLPCCAALTRCSIWSLQDDLDAKKEWVFFLSTERFGMKCPSVFLPRTGPKVFTDFLFHPGATGEPTLMLCLGWHLKERTRSILAFGKLLASCFDWIYHHFAYAAHFPFQSSSTVKQAGSKSNHPSIKVFEDIWEYWNENAINGMCVSICDWEKPWHETTQTLFL